MVEIDEKCLERFGRWPWQRDLVARLTRNILEQGAATVALDIMFPQKDNVNDQALADAISGKPVVVGYALSFGGGEAAALPCPLQSLPLAVIDPGRAGVAAFFHAAGAICNAPAISAAASSSGFLNAAPDRDGTLRHVPLVIEYGNRYYPSLALAALDLYRHVSTMQLTIEPHGARRLRLDDRVILLEDQSVLRLRFRGAGRRLPFVSAADVMAARPGEDMLRGRIAIVGGSASGMQNLLVTPVPFLRVSNLLFLTPLQQRLSGQGCHCDGRILGVLSFYSRPLIHLLSGSLCLFPKSPQPVLLLS